MYESEFQFFWRLRNHKKCSIILWLVRQLFLSSFSPHLSHLNLSCVTSFFVGGEVSLCLLGKIIVSLISISSFFLLRYSSLLFLFLLMVLGLFFFLSKMLEGCPFSLANSKEKLKPEGRHRENLKALPWLVNCVVNSIPFHQAQIVQSASWHQPFFQFISE